MAQTDNTYNGWTNYATWRVNLEIFDGLEIGDLSFNTDSSDAYDLELELKDYAESIITNDEIINNNLAVGYALAFMSEVNWTEIAKHMIDV